MATKQNFSFIPGYCGGYIGIIEGVDYIEIVFHDGDVAPVRFKFLHGWKDETERTMWVANKLREIADKLEEWVKT